jgi:hypothetical protein
VGRAVHWRPAGGWPAGCSGQVVGWEQWLGGWLGAGRLVVLLPTLVQAVHSHAARSDSRHKRARMPSLIRPCPLFAIPPCTELDPFLLPVPSSCLPPGGGSGAA